MCLQAASVSLMAAKDARLGLMGQLLAHIGVVKALGWEGVLGDKVRMCCCYIANINADSAVVAKHGVDGG
jgi:hypothetical protein